MRIFKFEFILRVIENYFEMLLRISTKVLILSTFILLMACSQKLSVSETVNSPMKIKTSSQKDAYKTKPNILWIVAEDLSEYMPSFGDSTIQTPHLSRLAAEGVCFDQFFSPAAVCAPARSSIALGMYPTHIGSNHMRTGPWYRDNVSDQAIIEYDKRLPEGVHSYEAIPPVGAKMMSEYLREAGYYCSNNSKEDYQFIKPVTAWDDSSNKAHWRNRKEGQPFFSIFNVGITHESQIWARAKDSLWVDQNLEVDVPPYLPDTKIGRQDIRRMYSNIKMMDQKVGEILNQLEEDGLLESTIIFWYTDHGGPLPRQKRLLYDSGIKVPLIVRFPDGQFANTRNQEMTSFIDLAPTVMSLVGLEPKSHMDGKAFLGDYKREIPARYVYSAADRFDESYDKIRSVRDRRYKLIRYFEPNLPMFLRIIYREQMPIMQELYRLRDEGLLTAEQKLWFRETKPEFEFFDTEKDPHEVHDLFDDPTYKLKIDELKSALDEWMAKVPDRNFEPEPKLLAKLWPDKKQPVTLAPTVRVQNGFLQIENLTKGASIAYQFVDGDKEVIEWLVYTKPIKIEAEQNVKVLAHRIGFKPSKMVLLR